MANRINFTKAKLDDLACKQGGGRTWYYDTKAPALAVMVTEAGAKSFYIYRRIDGRPQRVRLGAYPEMTPDQARKAAERVNGQIADGKNPAEQRRAKRLEMTLGDAFKDYLEKHAKVHKRPRSWGDDEKQWERYMDPWKGRKLSAVSQDTVAEIHRTIGTNNGHYAANRLLSLLSKVFNHARREPNPAKGITKFPEHARERFLHPDEFPRFWKSLEEHPDEKLRDFFKVSLLTGARRGNVQAMRWAHVNLDRATWTIPAEEIKGNRALAVTLAAPVVTILTARKRENDAKDADKRSLYVFPSYGKTGHLTEPKAAWADVLERAGLEDLRIHDLRRTLGSWQAMTGASLPIIGKSLGHRSQQTTAIYARLTLDPVKQSVDTATAAMLAAAARPAAKNVESTVKGGGGEDRTE